MNVKDVRKYIYTPGAAVHGEYKEYSLCSQTVQGRGGRHMEMSFLQALFLYTVGSQELVSGNQWEYCVAQKTSASIKDFFFNQAMNGLLTPMGQG